ncbi:MFS transporter [Plectonema radiosum NIES-515]|uniref:MFS transporter n=1 Tax=Plectonema radiosum NIES-515 TaxID=2986073 RepID=A0ABT3ASD3_9CYAN|nr:MFS transporter [Plectonema radiosum]MCV3212041.1 MFS transporter [Plectonema radiosum NIES-515]
MFSSLQTALKLCETHGFPSLPIAQAVVIPEVSLAFSGPKFLVAMLSGVLMAFAFQFLLTNFSVAIGISALGGDSSDDDSQSLGSTIRGVEAKVGIWALITASIALFVASFLAVKLSLIGSAVLGAIIGVVIWSAYFSLIVWLGSTAVGSLIGSLVKTATAGFQGMMGTATAALGANAAKNQMVSTAEDITAAVRRELTSGFDPDSIKNTLQSSLSSLQLPKLDVKDIRSQFDQLLKDVDLQSLGDSDILKNINRQTFVDLVSSRTDFSQKDINNVADQLEGAWQQVLNRKNPTEKVLSLLKTVSPEELNSDKLGEKLQELVTSGVGKGKESNGMIKQAIELGLGAAVPAMLKNVNLSNIDLEKITPQLQKLKEKLPDVDVEKIKQQLQNLSQQATAKLPGASNAIKADVEEYILNSFPWHFNRLTIKDEFKDVIYDQNADAGKVRRQLEELNLEYFTNLLKQRGDISEERIQEISEQMESDRNEVLEVVRQGESQQTSENFRTRIEEYLRSTGKEELNPEGIQRDFAKLLEDPEAGFGDLSDRFKEFDRDTLVQLIKQRQDISEEEANNIVGSILSTRDNVLNRAQELQEQAKAKADELRQKVEGYLRNTNKEELNPDAIKREFKVLLDDPQAGIGLLRDRLSQFDRDTLVQLLSQRQDLSEEQVNQVLDNFESVRNNILQAPQKAKEQYEQTTTAIAEYLRNTNLEELNPEGIKADLEKLLNDPKEGASALRDRLSQVDRETLVKLVGSSGNLSEEQVNQIIDSVQSAIDNIIKAPRRLANRATKGVLDFEANLENYLRNTNKEELNPDSIKRDLQLLLSSPRAGIGSLGDRVSKIDRSSVVALLSQREDISEEEANHIVDQIESVRNSLVEQFQQIQQRVQSVVEGTFGKIRNYLNALDRPELNYEGIKQDVTKVFDDPQAGFEALRDRLSHFDRDTLVAVISSREDISLSQANKIVDQIEASRDNVLYQAERIQKETQKRLNAIKEQAKKQAEETKKTVASAAWWLFGTALTSLAASAIAGAIAVSGIPFIG